MEKQAHQQLLKRHLLTAVLLALGLRFLSLYYVWGPQALDDYLDNLIPSWRHFQGSYPDIHNYRSPLYMWLLSYWLKLGSIFGVEHAISQIRWVYFLQALASLLGIFGVYRLSEKKPKAFVGIIAMYLVAAHGLMPFASTRSFMESFVMGPVTLGFALLADLDSGKRQDLKAYLGFVLLGICALLRFQAGLFYIAWMGLFLFEKKWRYFWLGMAFGFVLLGVEAELDLLYGRKAFQTLHDYFVFNSDQESAGVMPWYNTWITWLGFMYFPFSFLLGKSWWLSIKRNWRIFLPILFYVIIHSLNPHKEERYLYPILPLSFLIWAEAWTEVLTETFISLKSKWTTYLYYSFFGVFNTLVLAVGCLVNTQVGLIGPFGDIESKFDRVLYLDYDDIVMRNGMMGYFVRPPSQHILVKTNPDFTDAQARFEEHKELSHLVLLSRQQENEKPFKEVFGKLAQSYQCGELLRANSLSDQVLYWLNPNINERRRPTEYFICHRP